jgi:beta-phosphoglucomutase-like phosphatase (HAD superfamily)
MMADILLSDIDGTLVDSNALHAEAWRRAFEHFGPAEINPKMASDIAYWSKEFGVTGDQLHEAIRSHGTHVEKVRTALHPHKSA